MKRVRWLILLLLFFASVINYVDRQSLSILARTIQDDLGMTDLDYAHVVQMFLLAYMLSFLVAGWITDRLGARASMTLFIAWWSVANLLTGFVGSVRGLAATRFLLGAGESGLYTVAPKIVGQIFPPTQRGLAVGIYSAGATVGATLAPPLIAVMTLAYGWRAAFIAGGALGLVWIIPWLLINRSTGEEPRAVVAPPAPVARPFRWREILFCRAALLLLSVRILTDPVWQFILYWFPKYVTDEHGMSLSEVGRIGWVVYLAADIGGVGAGLLCGLLVRRGLRPADACKWVMVACAVIIPCCATIPHLRSQAVIMTVAAVTALAVFAFMVCVAAMAVEVLPSDRFGTTWGIVCAGSGLGGILFAEIVGRLVTSFSYTPVFALMACLHPVSLLLIWQAAKARTEPVPVVALAP